jgi:hypothetical protein
MAVINSRRMIRLQEPALGVRTNFTPIATSPTSSRWTRRARLASSLTIHSSPANKYQGKILEVAGNIQRTTVNFSSFLFRTSANAIRELKIIPPNNSIETS